MAATKNIRAEGVGGVAVSLIAAAMEKLGAPGWAWVLVLVIGVALGIFALFQWGWGWWKRKADSHNRSESDALVVTVDDEEWSPFDHRALILGVRVTVKNKTSKEQVLTGLGWRPIQPWSIEMMDIEVHKERHRLQQSRPQVHGTVPPHGTTIGWAWIAFVPNSAKGRPGYVLTIEDGIGNEYAFKFEPRPPSLHRVSR